MTNKNNPKVISVTGKVSKIKIGFTNAFSNPKTTATINDVTKLATATPGIKCAMITTRMAVIKILMSRFIMNIFYKSNII